MGHSCCHRLTTCVPLHDDLSFQQTGAERGFTPKRSLVTRYDLVKALQSMLLLP
jgi:hypothetical protein